MNNKEFLKALKSLKDAFEIRVKDDRYAVFYKHENGYEEFLGYFVIDEKE